MASDNVLLDNVAANTTGAAVRCSCPVAVFVFSPAAGETVTIQVAYPTSAGANSGNYIDIDATTAKKVISVWLPGVFWIRAVLSGYVSGNATVAMN